ncbi:DUF397 domain-containing protein [Actinoalloteichus spitiensis]|uniref:DUF397 domain-containing protein n=1 Tax=Actinoalloteichus spitiensis TaxID=252394 RepID=UPI000312D171|nr:DUF397 domain-containing protein [Actinoalloteichus spitiensis]
MTPAEMTPAGRLAWRTSTRSSNGENCVEVAPVADGVVIRHSKNPAVGTISFPCDAWTAFIRDASEEGRASANGVASITRIGTDTLVRSLITEVELRFDEDEWSAFLAGVANGEFDFTNQLAIA